MFELPGANHVGQRRAGSNTSSRTRCRTCAPGSPAPQETRAGGWAGLRPATPDSLPLLGPLDGLPGLLVATGHGMLGVTLAPASGLAIADMIETGRVPKELEPFKPLRRM